MRVLVLASSLLLAAVAAGSAFAQPPAAPAVTFTQAAFNADTVTTSTGLRYIEGIAGDGGVVAWCRNVAVHYDAFLADGTKFDSSHDLGQPLVFAPGLGGLIDGFEQGVIGMRVGGKRRLIIPPELAFGAQDRRKMFDGQPSALWEGSNTPTGSKC